MEARIYRPTKTAMQSGRAKSRRWVLEYERRARRTVDRLMGWTGCADTTQQVRLGFATRDDAVAFAERNALAYRIEEPREPRARLKAYADNFRPDRPA